MRVLLVEDDELLGSGIKQGLELDGCAVDWVKDGVSAESFLRAQTYDLLLLDIGLPRKSGLEVLRDLRAVKNDTPVLILTARDTSRDVVIGLDSGADDYVIKPFDLDELLARMRALARRRSGRASPVITHGDVTLDPASHAVTLRGDPVELSPREFALLHTLLENRNRVLSRGKLEESLYSWSQEVDSNAVEVHIHHLRKKLGAKFIKTIRGVGYVIEQMPTTR